MNTATLYKDLKNLFFHLQIADERLQAAAKAGFLEMAHYIDLPDAQDFPKDITVVSETPNYDLTLTTGSAVDRITSAVFVSGTTRQILGDSWTERTYQHHYRGLAQTGVPSECCYFKDQLWLYKIPNLSGTIYTTCQSVVTDVTDFPDNYFPLMVALTAKHLFRTSEDPAGIAIYLRADRDRKDLIKSFKKRMHPKKMVMEKSTYRSRRIQRLNSLR